jgi:hypothetical protein
MQMMQPIAQPMQMQNVQPMQMQQQYQQAQNVQPAPQQMPPNQLSQSRANGLPSIVKPSDIDPKLNKEKAKKEAEEAAKQFKKGNSKSLTFEHLDHYEKQKQLKAEENHE